MSLSSDLTAIKNLSDGVKNNKVTRFAYTQNAYNNNDVNGHSDYVYDRDNNIPTADLSVIEVNPTVVDKGFRARASSLTRMLLNHLFGRISYNLNKVNDLFNELLVKVLANMGVANGFATLDANGRIPYSQLPEDAMEYQGEWNAQTNTPHLEDGTGTRGDTYNVSVAGTQTFGGQSIYFFVGDRVIYNENGVWQRLESGNVQSVCEILPDPTTGNVDLTQQADITKILNSNFLGKLLEFFMGRFWLQGTGANTTFTFVSVHYADGIWVACSVSHGLWWSEDGKVWTQSSTSAISSYNFRTAVFANGIWVAGSDNHGVWWSTDGKTWTQGTGFASNYTAYCASYVDGLWTIGSNGYGIWWSTDGKTWTQGTGSNTSYIIHCIVHANGLWVAGSDGHGTWWSTDGKSWTQGTGSNTASVVYDVYYANGIWVATTSSAGIWWSADGKTWSQETGSSTGYGFFGVYYSNGMWVAGSDSHGLWYSEDGKNWTQATGASTSTFISVKYANSLWTAESTTAGLWISNDGKNWWQTDTMNITNTLPFTHISFFEGMFIVASTAGLWYSDWTTIE